MSLETHIAGAEDKLLDTLHFEGKTSASYVTERRSVSFAPQAASNFTPQRVRLMRLNLADQTGWLEGSTLRLIFALHNARASNLIPVCDSPASLFRHVRLIGNGSAMIEDIEEYGRVHDMFSRLQSSARRYNAFAEGGAATRLTRRPSTTLESRTRSRGTRGEAAELVPYAGQGDPARDGPWEGRRHREEDLDVVFWLDG
jgi:hypothetical protein